MDRKTSIVGSSCRIGYRLKISHPNLPDARINYATWTGCSYSTERKEVNNFKETQNSTTSFCSMDNNTSSCTSSSSSSSFSNFSSRAKSSAVQGKRLHREKKMNSEKSNTKMQIEPGKCHTRDVDQDNSTRIPRVARFGVLTSNNEDTSSANLQSKQRSGSRNFYSPTISSTQRSIASRERRLAIANNSQIAGAGSPRNSLKKCSVSSISNTEKDKTKCLDGGKASSSRGKSISAFSNRKMMGSPIARNDSKSSNKSNTSGQLSLHRAQKVTGRGSTRRLSGEGNSSLSLPESSIVPWVPQNVFSISQMPDNVFSFIGYSTSTRTESTSSVLDRPDSCPEQDSVHVFSDLSRVTDNNHHFNFDRVAEALLVLEAMQHDQALAYEQLLVLEPDTSFDSLNFRDQYRGMRMDIDNMSYEELLDLEEKIGSVNTGLTEEVLTKCLVRTTFKEASSTSAAEVDNTCSICRECCVDGDEISRLGCEHWFHVECILQWLRLKNWCPICKASALNS